MTHRQPNWVFQFLIRVTEVNCNIADHYIYEQDLMYKVTFWWELSEEFINNPYLKIKKIYRAKICAVTAELAVHQVLSLTQFTIFKGIDLVTCKKNIFSLNATNTKKRIIKYCKCSPGVIQRSK